MDSVFLNPLRGHSYFPTPQKTGVMFRYVKNQFDINLYQCGRHSQTHDEVIRIIKIL